MKRSTSESIDGGSVTNLLWDKYSGANKVVSMAPELVYVTSDLVKEIGPYETLHVYNDNSDTAWLILTEEPNGNPQDRANKRPLAPKSWLICNNAKNTFISGNNSAVSIYKVKSDSKVQG